MEVTEAGDQLEDPSLESASTVDSTPAGADGQEARSGKDDDSANQPPTNSEPRAKGVLKSAKNDVTSAVQSRIKDLFWLENKSQKEIREILKNEWPTLAEKTCSNFVESTLRDERKLGVRDGNGNRYLFSKVGLTKFSGSGDDLRSAQIANFQCLSLTPIVRDDGVQQAEFIRLELGYKDLRETIELTPDEFRQMNWHFRLFNQQATVAPRMKEYAAVGIQLATPRKDKITIYTSTGWFEIDGQPYFFHNDGAIGANEHRRDLKAELKENLRLYSLPDPPTGERLKTAIRASLKFLEVGEPSVVVPLFAAVWRAPLGNADFVGWGHGVTNSLKTSHAVVAQQFYGKNFDKKHLPATWSSTANFNLSRLHAAKDVFIVIDDFVRRGSSMDQKRQQAEADRFVRGVADGAFRGRLDAKHSDDAPSRGPRGMVWSTAETNPLGHSGQARLISPTYRRKDDGTPISIDPVRLRESQREAESGLYSEAMAAYIQFLAQRHNDLFQSVQERIRELSTAMSESADGQLLRTPEILASLAVGVEYFLFFAKSVEAISREEYQTIWEQSWNTLVSFAEVQTQRLHQEDPIREALQLLKSADRAGRLTFNNPEVDGMEVLGVPSFDVNRYQSQNALFVGWRKNEGSDWWCDPDQLWKVIQILFREQNREVPKTKVELFEEMESGGWITPRDEKSRPGVPTVKRSIRGDRHRVVQIPLKSFDRLEQEGTSEEASRDRTEPRIPASPPNRLGKRK